MNNLKDSEPLVSVVVPVYNDELYLEECLCSICGNSYRNLEIILVDDGSVDSSGKICDEFAEKDKRIKVVHQQNQGVAKVRRVGTRLAKAELIMYSDADDTVDSELIRWLVEHSVIDGADERADLVTVDILEEGKYGTWKIYDTAIKAGVYDTPEKLRYFKDNMYLISNNADDAYGRPGIGPFINAKLYKREKMLQVMEEQDSKLMWGEDNEYLWCYIFLCSQIVITHRISYYYRYNPLSICHNEAAKPNKLRERIIMNDEMMKFMANHGCTDRDIHLFKRWYARELMGHLENEHLPKDMLPVEWHHRYGDALDNNRIVLYGAGNVGCDYYRAFKKQLSKQDIFWTDKRWQEKQNDYIDIRPVDELHGFDYDYVVIAVAEEPLAAQIREELVTSGVEDQKILWKKPLNMREL